MTSFGRGASVTGKRLTASGSIGVVASRRLCADTCDTRESQRSVGNTPFCPRDDEHRPLSPDDYEFVLLEWWLEPASASGRWYVYECVTPRGRAMGCGDTALAAVTDAGREYDRRVA